MVWTMADKRMEDGTGKEGRVRGIPRKTVGPLLESYVEEFQSQAEEGFCILSHKVRR